MAEKLEVNPKTRIDQVGRTGIYPASGPQPSIAVPVRGQGELAHPEERHRPKLLTSGTQTGTSAVLALGRALFGGYFLYNGINHFVNRSMMSDYARSREVPAAALAVPASGALIIIGGLSVLTGVQPKIGASLIATFLLGVSPQMHDFWNVEDPQQRMAEMVNFTKNMALVGAACLTAAIPEPWPLSPRIDIAA
jgi:uncharacterized membrane protein YphA (DoxX/SURF4 family)